MLINYMMEHYNQYKNFKKKLILKYKKGLSRTSTTGKILDSFVSIDDFLSVEMSKGPNESPGNINYFYQDYCNVFNFFNILYNHYHFNEILCIPNFVIKYKEYIDSTAIVYFRDVDELIIPYKLISKIKKCMYSNKRFIYFMLVIDSKSGRQLSHANVIVIDLYKKTLERFEPYGIIKDKLQESINNAIETRLLNILEIDNFKYLAPFDISPNLGPQAKADAYGGMCVTFSMLYLQLRLMNPDIIQKQLINYLVNKKDLRKLVLRYAKFIETTLKNYDNQIFEQQEYINKKYYSTQDYIISGSNKKYIIQK